MVVVVVVVVVAAAAALTGSSGGSIDRINLNVFFTPGNRIIVSSTSCIIRVLQTLALVCLLFKVLSLILSFPALQGTGFSGPPATRAEPPTHVTYKNQVTSCSSCFKEPQDVIVCFAF